MLLKFNNDFVNGILISLLILSCVIYLIAGIGYFCLWVADNMIYLY